ncbi:MAG: phosphoribosylamine--glycine ligase [Pseudomonadota bacterium]
MKILIVGSGAREHALAKALARSPQQPEIYCYGTSNNPGIRALTTRYSVGDICNVPKVVQQAEQWEINIAIIGPEAPLEQGLADALWQSEIPTIGPKKKLAQIETSKTFTRNLLKKYQIPGAVEYRAFTELWEVREYLEHLGSNQYVIKANGLMGGKGVKVGGEHLHNFKEAYQFCEALHGAGQSFVIEEKLVGQEFSLMCFCDGTRLVPMPIVQDHKRAYVDDLGPNTGGMGSYSLPNHSLPFLSEKDLTTAHRINQGIITSLTAEYREPYVGFLYGSFMATKNGVQLIEFNARLGDPEALNVLAILQSDFLAICQAMVRGMLSPEMVQFENYATVCKYAVPDGYPDNALKNVLIDISAVKDREQLYLAAVNSEDEKLYATGSRAVAVVGIADNVLTAEAIAETEICRISGKLFHREDIGTRDLINRRIRQMQALRQRDYRML